MPASAPVASVRQLVVPKCRLLAAEIVRAVPAGQVVAEPLHTWPVRQTSLPQGVPAVWKPSAGQAAEVPVQLSATSQTPAEARQTVPAPAKPSTGQVGDDPLQLSGTSQAPA